MAAFYPTPRPGVIFGLLKPGWLLDMFCTLISEDLSCLWKTTPESLRFQACQTSDACVRLAESRYSGRYAILNAKVFSDLIAGVFVAVLEQILWH